MKPGQKEENQNLGGFPEDVITDILVRNPLKDLARSRCVSKYWNTLITSPSFIKAHLRRSSQYGSHLLYQNSTYSEQFMSDVFSGRREIYDIDDCDNFAVSKLRMRFSGSSEFTNLDPPRAIADGFNNIKLVGSCNGIVCLNGLNEGGSIAGIWLWNPAINDCFALPEPGFPIPSSTGYCVGFGFNPFSSHLGDFKVVSITDYNEWHKTEKNRSSRVEIYSRRTNSWKELIDCFPKKWCSCIGNMGDQVIFEEYICWLPYCRRRSGNDGLAAILSFNVVTEEFREMALADSIPCYETDCITILDGCLSLLARCSKGRFEVWTMKEFGNIESWSKLYNIDLMSGELTRASFRPLGVGSTDEAVFSVSYFVGLNIPSPTYLLSYDIKMMTIIDNSTTTHDSSFIGRLARYVESLIPVSCISSLEEEEEEEEEEG